MAVPDRATRLMPPNDPTSAIRAAAPSMRCGQSLSTDAINNILFKSPNNIQLRRRPHSAPLDEDKLCRNCFVVRITA